MDDAKTEVLAFTAFPAPLFQGVEQQPAGTGQQSTSSAEPGWSGIFPNAAAIRLVGEALADLHN